MTEAKRLTNDELEKHRRCVDFVDPPEAAIQLLNHIAALQADLAECREMLRDRQWEVVNGDTVYDTACCRECRATEYEVHKPDCKLAALLARTNRRAVSE